MNAVEKAPIPATKKMAEFSIRRINPDTPSSESQDSAQYQNHLKLVNHETDFSDAASEAIALKKPATKNRRRDDPLSRGVYQRKNGKWSTEIRSGKSRIWLGTFVTKEEARRAYLSKKMEIEGPTLSRSSGGYESPEEARTVNSVNLETGEKSAASSCSVQGFGTSDTVDSGEAPEKSKRKYKRPYPGVFYRWGKWSAEVRNPFMKRKMWLGSFRSPDEAWAAVVAKKQEFDAVRLNLEKELFRRTHPSAGESNLATEEGTPAKGVTAAVQEPPGCSGECSEEEVSILKRFTEGIGRHDIDYIMKIASHIIDSYGNFLGEFSFMDDLQIR